MLDDWRATKGNGQHADGSQPRRSAGDRGARLRASRSAGRMRQARARHGHCRAPNGRAYPGADRRADRHPQGRLSEWATGKRTPKAVTTFQKFANGVWLAPGRTPRPRARRRLAGRCRDRNSADARVSYPATPEQAVRNVSHLWIADLDDATLIRRGRADPRAWNDASLRWLVDPARWPEDQPTRGVHIGMADVERFRATVDVFAKLDDRVRRRARPASARPVPQNRRGQNAQRQVHRGRGARTVRRRWARLRCWPRG